MILTFLHLFSLGGWFFTDMPVCFLVCDWGCNSFEIPEGVSKNRYINYKTTYLISKSVYINIYDIHFITNFHILFFWTSFFLPPWLRHASWSEGFCPCHGCWVSDIFWGIVDEYCLWSLKNKQVNISELKFIQK